MHFPNYGLKVISPIVDGGFVNTTLSFNDAAEFNRLSGFPTKISIDGILEQPITPKKVIFNNPATIVFWTDGSKTVSKASKDDEFDKMKGFLTCYYKKISNTSNSQFGKLYDKFNNTNEVVF